MRKYEGCVNFINRSSDRHAVGYLVLHPKMPNRLRMVVGRKAHFLRAKPLHSIIYRLLDEVESLEAILMDDVRITKNAR